MSSPGELIRAAFETRVAGWAAALSPPLPLSYENTPFIVPKDNRYARVYVVPGATQAKFMEGTHREFVGVFQVSLNLPLNTGPGTTETLANSLDELFSTTGPIVQGGMMIWLTSPMSKAGAITNPDAYVVPVSCRYKAEFVKTKA